MATSQEKPGYLIWAVDNVVYGPVDLTLLLQWVDEERITADTWVFDQEADGWQKASQIGELRDLFQGVQNGNGFATHTLSDQPALEEIKAGMLRRMKILANLSDAELERLRHHLRVVPARQWSVVVKQGDPGDGMFLILEGEVRVRLMIDGKETIIATLSAGEFFGELSLFDHGPRSADVLANTQALLMKLPVSHFQNLVIKEPDLAAPFLTAICKTLAARIRADNKRFCETIHMARVAPPPVAWGAP